MSIREASVTTMEFRRVPGVARAALLAVGLAACGGSPEPIGPIGASAQHLAELGAFGEVVDRSCRRIEACGCWTYDPCVASQHESLKKMFAVRGGELSDEARERALANLSATIDIPCEKQCEAIARVKNRTP